MTRRFGKLWIIAQASDFVSEKEGQLDATVEAFGRNFSGGQRQRLTIARAIVQKAPLLFWMIQHQPLIT